MAKTVESLKAALRSWRIGAVALLSLSSGLPFGLVVVAVPAWLKLEGLDIKTIGALTLVQTPYAFKFLWAPIMDRFHPPLLGRKRGWILLAQLALAALTAVLATQAGSPTVALVATVALLAAFLSATQDIAIDGYAVESLRKEEQGLAVGARTALYLIGALVSGKLAISVAGWIGWSATIAVPLVFYAGLAIVTLRAAEPETPAPPPASLRESVWDPFVGFFRTPRALEIAAFVLLFKLADNLAGSLVSPFLLEKGYDLTDVGIATATIGLVSSTLGTLGGGLLTQAAGLGRALWIAGFLQAASNVGYALIAQAPVTPWLMYLAIAVETVTSGLGTGAFGVLLLRLTQKRFSATQFALFSSLFALGRTVSGPVAGVAADAVGWRDFFLATIPAALPGLFMLSRFVSPLAREIPEFTVETLAARSPVSRAAIAARAVAGFAAGTLTGFGASAALSALKVFRETAVAARKVLAADPSNEGALEKLAANHVDVPAAFARLLHPARPGDWLDLVGPVVLGAVVALGVAAYVAARRGVWRPGEAALEQGR